MDEKLDKLLGGCPGYWLNLRDSEKQIWFDAQEAMLEVGYRKPQQPAEGELAPNTCQCYCAMEGRQSQRAFMLSQGYRKLPSEDEFPEMLRRATETALSKNKLGIVDNFDLIAQELLRLLGEKP